MPSGFPFLEFRWKCRIGKVLTGDGPGKPKDSHIEPTEDERESVLARYGPPWTVPEQTSTPVGKPLNTSRPAFFPKTNLHGITLGWNVQGTAQDELFAAVEGTSFQTRIILDRMAEQGVRIKRVINAGRIPQKNNLLNQIYANVLGETGFSCRAKPWPV